MASALVAGIAAGSGLGGVLVSGAGASAPFVLSCAATALAAVMALAVVAAGARRVSRTA